MSSSGATALALKDVDALTFDVFGTVVDWQNTVARDLASRAAVNGIEGDWISFAKEWRQGYYTRTRAIAAGAEGSLDVDAMHREILDEMLRSPRWFDFAGKLDESERQAMSMIWHTLDGWPDTSPGLHALKRQVIIATLSNGNVRLLVDMARHADLPWDAVFSGELLGSFKPNPKMYLGAAHHLRLPPAKIAMVAAHIEDLRAAASHGMRTVYVRRHTEDEASVREAVKAKRDGGEVDLVVDSFLELAAVLESRQ